MAETKGVDASTQANINAMNAQAAQQQANSMALQNAQSANSDKQTQQNVVIKAQQTRDEVRASMAKSAGDSLGKIADKIGG